VNTETLITNSFLDLVQQGNVVFIVGGGNFGSDVEVLDVWEGLVKDREFVEMGCKEGKAADLGCNVPGVSEVLARGAALRRTRDEYRTEGSSRRTRRRIGPTR
jgi:hypothetical protein